MAEWSDEQKRDAEKTLYRRYGYVCSSYGTIIDVQCEVTALRQAVKELGGYLMTAKLKNQPEWMEYIPAIIAEADAILARTN